VGGTDSVSDSIMGKLPSPQRLGGADINATATAVTNEVKARGLPVNVVYVAEQGRSVDAAVAGAAIARVGGLLLVTPGADGAAAEKMLNGMGLGDSVDQIFVTKSTSPSSVPWVLFVVIGIFALVGLVLLGWARQKSLAAGGSGATQPSTATPAKT